MNEKVHVFFHLRHVVSNQPLLDHFVKVDIFSREYFVLYDFPTILDYLSFIASDFQQSPYTVLQVALTLIHQFMKFNI